MTDPVVLTAGQQAPDIDAVATGGAPFRLSEQRGRWVVVYFYPRANTPG
jgi:peroxiredoxin Q/BCP